MRTHIVRFGSRQVTYRIVSPRRLTWLEQMLLLVTYGATLTGPVKPGSVITLRA